MKLHVINKYFATINQDTEVILVCKIIFKNFTLSGPEIDRLLKKYDIDPLSLTFKVKATAHLKPEDTFNAEIGRRVAESKAMRKVFHKLSALNLDFQIVVANEIIEDTDRYMWALANENLHFNNLSNGQTTNS